MADEQRKPRIHFVNRYFHPDLSATSQTLAGIAFDLARRGHDVAVVTSRQLYESPAARLPDREAVADLTITRVWSARFGRGGLGGRLLDYLTFHVAAAAHLLLAVRRGDIVVVKTDPPLLNVLALPIARLRGATCVAWMQDVFPEIVTALGVGGWPGRALCRALRGVRNWSLRRVDRVVAIGNGMARHLASEGVARARIAVIPNWADPEVVRPVPEAANALRREWGLEGRIVVGYAGNLGHVHEIDTIVGAIERLRRLAEVDATVAKLAFVFVGGGAGRRRLEQRLAALGIGRLHFKPYQPAARLAETLSAIDIHLVSLLPACEGLVLPSKIYGVMAAARPAIFVGDPSGDVARLIEREQCGRVAPAGDPDTLVAVIADLARDPGLRDAMGAAARAAFEAAYTRETASQAWHGLLAGLLQGEAARAIDAPDDGLPVPLHEQ